MQKDVSSVLAETFDQSTALIALVFLVVLTSLPSLIVFNVLAKHLFRFWRVHDFTPVIHHSFHLPPLHDHYTAARHSCG